MKRRVYFLLICVVIVSLSACSKKTASSKVDAAPTVAPTQAVETPRPSPTPTAEDIKSILCSKIWNASTQVDHYYRFYSDGTGKDYSFLDLKNATYDNPGYTRTFKYSVSNGMVNISDYCFSNGTPYELGESGNWTYSIANKTFSHPADSSSSNSSSSIQDIPSIAFADFYEKWRSSLDEEKLANDGNMQTADISIYEKFRDLLSDCSQYYVALISTQDAATFNQEETQWEQQKEQEKAKVDQEGDPGCEVNRYAKRETDYSMTNDRIGVIIERIRAKQSS